MSRLLAESRLGWGNIAEMDPYVLEREGVKAAYNDAWRRASSEHRASSGRTESIEAREGRKGRKEHYRRKAELERKKEEARRAAWIARFPGASEVNWVRREAQRKTRKQAAKAARRARRGTSKRQ